MFTEGADDGGGTVGDGVKGEGAVAGPDAGPVVDCVVAAACSMMTLMFRATATTSGLVS